MRLHALTFLVVGLLVAADAPKDDAARKDLEKLQGTWALASAERDGKKVPSEEVKRTKITFEGETFLFPGASGVGTSKKGTLKVDPTKRPKWMDAAATDDAHKGQVSLGIYEITGDGYQVCFAPPGKERPKEFSSKAGSGHILQVWVREKK